MAKAAKPPTVGDERPRSSKPKGRRDAGDKPERSAEALRGFVGDKPDGDGETVGMPIGLVLLFVVPLLALLAWGLFMN